jgi:ribulose 1,5-bisphosphate synthetase/thiazole synthase
MLVFPVRRPFQKPTYEYDITVIGAGASGLLAAGVASCLSSERKSMAARPAD